MEGKWKGRERGRYEKAKIYHGEEEIKREKDSEEQRERMIEME